VTVLKKVNHIAVAVKSIAEARGFYEKGLGLTMSAIEEVAAQKVRVAFFQIGEVKIELLEPSTDDSPVAKFLETKGPGLHHICFETASVADGLAHLAAEGVPLIDKAPRPGAHGTMVGFVHPKGTGGVLTELCQPGEGH
jgi:methylmalonyl-CoA/ethylmalonyl-CoA epimerase